jgi:hypothetical protein
VKQLPENTLKSTVQETKRRRLSTNPEVLSVANSPRDCVSALVRQLSTCCILFGIDVRPYSGSAYDSLLNCPLMKLLLSFGAFLIFEYLLNYRLA